MTEQSAELELLDQLLGEDMGLDHLRALFAEDEAFVHSVEMMLKDGDVILIDRDETKAPAWKWRQVLADPLQWVSGTQWRLSLTARGSNRVA